MILAYYVSSHGFGHSKRASGIIKEMLTLDPELKIIVRTLKDPAIYGFLRRTCFSRPLGDFEMVERDALDIDRDRTVSNLTRFMDTYDVVTEEEIEFIKRWHVTGLVSDVPFLAGHIAGKLRLRCAMVVNFTWDWILEPFLKANENGQRYLKQIRDDYRQVTLVVQTPFCHDLAETFPGREVKRVEFALCDCESEPQPKGWKKLKDRLQVIGEFEKVALYDIRGLPIKPDAIKPIAERFEDIFFLFSGKQTVLLRNNLAQLGPEFAYDEVMNACSLLIGKLGYCTVGRCIASGKRLLYPKREGFREDEMWVPIANYIPAKEISRETAEGGHWGKDLAALLNMPVPFGQLPLNGARQCAELFLAHLSGEA